MLGGMPPKKPSRGRKRPPEASGVPGVPLDTTDLIVDPRQRLIARLGLLAVLARRELPSQPRNARKALRDIDSMLRGLCPAQSRGGA